ncbi:death on curing protein [Verrucomicrobium sp. GAS474]|uniref:type II toxin-antitoxin system death-on-curing family toxin n=1 Tax=Verrucomicrobium sp. GAS474 TaxID=1882831 RepID=UPI00087D2A29|nr:type II toxin-antitoxin system death-on-curing family toxin [Verrucomicrobium sp. GAS474]SDT87006.1 death on curing protein [Verrucomicrobium sp. GAS474]
MADWIYLTVAQVLEIHASVLEEHGGAAGIRDGNLLESAVHAPQASMGGKLLFTDPVEIAAAYLFYLCRNRAFIDGNKRVALVSCIVFLRLNGLQTKADGPEWEELVLDVAASRLDRDATLARVRERME